ncbi:MAG: YaeQ family protein [Deltaproteobacteria bacterium]|nr:YaeQ family protein [Deltaproteobacteria bacterium]
MAQPSMVRRFEIDLADSDRGVYEALDLRAAQHPSETDRYLVARVIARCLEHAEGLVFTKGLTADDEPALWQRDLTDRLLAWIEVGAPSTDRLHRASKLGARVVVYAYQRPKELAKQIVEAKVHRADQLEVRALDPAFLDRVAATLDRNNRWELSVSGGGLYLTIGGKLFETTCERVVLTQ